MERADNRAGETRITRLRTNFLDAPLAVDDPRPSFSWRMETDRSGAKQIAFRILISTGEKTCWDSGKVSSGLSVGIRYPGEGAEALQPETGYRWQVTVWDEQGTETTARATFRTGLMSTGLAQWHGAKWIGSAQISLAAETLPVFRMRYTLKIRPGGTAAGIVFGASDPRLNRSTQNNDLIHGENYLSFQLDISTRPAVIRIFRKGYSPEDHPDLPMETLEIPESVICEENKYAEHDFEIVVSGCQMEVMTVDGTPLETDEKQLALVSSPLKPVTERTHLVLNPTGKIMDTPVFPRLCQIGFLTDERTEAVFTHLTLRHYGGAQNIIFSEDTGATYNIFRDLNGVQVSGKQIAVSPGTLAYADPSFGSVPMLRKEFCLNRPVSSVLFYAAAMGIYELTLNGQKVGNEFLANGAMDFNRRIFYEAYDVTGLVREGSNAGGAVLASGWFQDQLSYDVTQYNWYGDRPAFLGLLAVRYADGTSEYIPTDESWQVFSHGPVRYAANFNGETYDARLETAVEGWNRAGFSGQGWLQAALMDSRVQGLEPAISAKPDTGIRHTHTRQARYLGAQTRGSDQDTVYLYDMGVNMVGLPRITFPRGIAGNEVTVRYAEMLYPELDPANPYYYGKLGGLILTENLRGALVTDRYIMKGEADEVFFPRFTFHGYRYVEISGLPEPIPGENIEGLVLSSVVPAASYESSNPLTNQLFENIIRSTTGNFLSIPTDCPQRDERLGWAGDAQVYSETATYMADVAAFYRYYDQLQNDAQGPDGTYHLYAPSQTPPGVAFALGYTWNAAGVVIPCQSWLQYGDPKLLEECWPAMKRHAEGMMAMKAKGYRCLTSHIGFLGDHLSVTDTDPFLMDNAQFYRSMRLVQRAAEVLGFSGDAERFSAFADGLREEWNAVFVRPDHHTQAADGTLQDTQASYALPLMCGVFSGEHLPFARKNLAEACRRTGYTMTTGFMGTGPLLPALTEGGEADCAYRLFEQTGYPSWLYPVLNGATTVWERWGSYTIENGFGGQNGMNSFNHYSLGAVAAWMIEYQAGIRRDGGEHGFRHFILQPVPGGHFRFVRAVYDSCYGIISSGWTASDGRLSAYEATVPPNTAATLYLPIREKDVPQLCGIPGAEYRNMAVHNGIMTAVFSLEPGQYHFEWRAE